MVRLLLGAITVFFLCAGNAASSNQLPDFYKMMVIEPGRDKEYLEPVVLIPRGIAYAHQDNKLKNFKVVVEFWHRETGENACKLIGSTTYDGVAGSNNGFNLGFSPQLKAGRGWVGVKVVDADGQIRDWSINNYTVKAAPVPPPFPVPPPVPPVPPTGPPNQ